MYLKQVARAWECGIGSHMEIMTHGGLFDFENNSVPKDAQHEGVWLHEPEVAVEQYERYFGNIIAEGDRAGVRFTGFTWPGCSCEACTKRYKELRAAGHTEPNPAMWQALLNLARQGKFRGPTVPCFFGSNEANVEPHRKAADGQFGVYDSMPNAGDYFATYRNSEEYVKPDYYITADGKSGIIVRHVETGAPYCLWYSHWQGVNPVNGKGWEAFNTVIARIHASTCKTAWFGCVPAKLPTASTRPTGGVSWTQCNQVHTRGPIPFYLPKALRRATSDSARHDHAHALREW